MNSARTVEDGVLAGWSDLARLLRGTFSIGALGQFSTASDTAGGGGSGGDPGPETAGKRIREISRTLEVSRNTVRSYLRSEGLPRYQRELRPSKLDPLKQYINKKVKAAAPQWISGDGAFARDYQGGYSIFKDYLATLRLVAMPEPVIRFETDPGRQMQADFVTI